MKAEQALSPGAEEAAPPCPICELSSCGCKDDTGLAYPAPGVMWYANQKTLHVLRCAGLVDIPRADTAVLLNCMHVFCIACISRWAKLRRECPLCKVRAVREC